MNRTARTPRAALPMPLWLQGGVEALFAVLFPIALIVVPLSSMWWLGAFRDMPLETVGALAGQIWLGTHGVPLQLSIAVDGAEPITGTWWFLGWAGVLIPLLFGFRAGRRLFRACTTSSMFWQPLVGAVLTWALAGLALTSLVSTPEVTIHLAAGALIPVAWMTLALLVGARREAGSWTGLLGKDATGWLERTSQVSRWTGSYLWSVLRSAVVGVFAAYALASVLLSVQMMLQWASITDVYQRLGSGVIGGSSLTVIQLGIMPNVGMWTLSYLTGAGFLAGTGSLVAPSGSTVGAQPAIPLLSAIPTGQSLESTWWLLLLPVAAGIVAGWWLFREGENHLEDWFRARITQPVLALGLSTLVLGLLVGIAVAVVSYLPFLFSGGSWAIGKFTEVGPVAWIAALLLGAQLAVGAMIGYLIAPWGERDRYVGPETDETDETMGDVEKSDAGD